MQVLVAVEISPYNNSSDYWFVVFRFSPCHTRVPVLISSCLCWAPLEIVNYIFSCCRSRILLDKKKSFSSREASENGISFVIPFWWEFLEVLQYEIWLKSIFTAFINNVIDKDIDLSKINKSTNMSQTKLLLCLITQPCVFVDNVKR